MDYMEAIGCRPNHSGGLNRCGRSNRALEAKDPQVLAAGEIYDEYWSFMDTGDWADWKFLDETFPNARFVLNTRCVVGLPNGACSNVNFFRPNLRALVVERRLSKGGRGKELFHPHGNDRMSGSSQCNSHGQRYSFSNTWQYGFHLHMCL
jgi:hypothetical protein